MILVLGIVEDGRALWEAAGVLIDSWYSSICDATPVPRSCCSLLPYVVRRACAARRYGLDGRYLHRNSCELVLLQFSALQTELNSLGSHRQGQPVPQMCVLEVSFRAGIRTPTVLAVQPLCRGSGAAHC